VDYSLGGLLVHQQRNELRISNTDYWADDTLGELIVHQQRYEPRISNTDYWADDTLGGLIVHQQRNELRIKSPLSIICPVVSVTNPGLIPLLVDY
jgi:hypothetical protein